MVQRKQLVEEFLHEVGAIRRLTHAGGEHLLGRFGLTRSQVAVLFAFKHQPVMTVGEMAEQLGVSGGAATQMVEIMVRRGLIERTPDAADRRVTRLALSTEGKTLARQVATFAAERIGQLLEQLDEDELRQLIGILQKLGRVIDEAEKE